MLQGHKFEHNVVMHEGKAVKALQCNCGGCTFVQQIKVNTFSVTTGREADIQTFQTVKRKLEKDGWFIGNSWRQDRCPRCIAEQRSATARDTIERQKEKQQVSVVSARPNPQALLPPGGIVNGEVMRKPSFEENKLIRMKLEEVYIENNGGYQPGWTDARVATDLGCPRAWVAANREMNFGTVTTNPEIEIALRDVKKHVELAREVLVAFQKRADEFELQLRKDEVIIRDLEEKYK